jgi:uncharacterized protein (DUF2345 family)
VAISAKGALALSAADSVQLSTGETVSVMSGQDAQFISGGQLRVHSKQAIGLLGGVVKPGEQGLGFQMIAAAGVIDVQAQSDSLSVQARDDVNVVSANANIDWAAAKRISLSTAGGANITIDGGNITVQCPGKVTIHAGVKSFTGPAQLNYPTQKLPRVPIKTIPLGFAIRLQDTPGLEAEPYSNADWRIVRANGINRALESDAILLSGVADDDGRLKLSKAEEEMLQNEYNISPNDLWVIANSHARQLEIGVTQDFWSDATQFNHGLNALGYADDHMTTNGVDVDDFHGLVARTDLKTASGTKLLEKMKKV